MPQSLANVYVHAVFSVKSRKPLLTDGMREPLHAYIGGTLRSFGCPLVAINSVDDHIHILFRLARDKALSDTVKVVKEKSSKWIKAQGAQHAGFAWQRGFGAFSVSESNTGKVREYISRQREYHAKVSFEEEYRELLKRNGLEPDERYFLD